MTQPAIADAEVRMPFPGRLRLSMPLGPGSLIKEHEDPDLSFEEGLVRLHVPVANDQVAFHLNHSRVVMEAGSTWYLRLSDPHSVVNGGATDRIHLVMDAVVNDWIAAAFAAAMRELERGTASSLAPPLPIGERERAVQAATPATASAA
jgi:hypothetical protein